MSVPLTTRPAVLLGAFSLIIFATVLLMSPVAKAQDPATPGKVTGFTEVTGNEPGTEPTPGEAPNPAKCREQWEEFFGAKKGSPAVLKCCTSYKSCQCIKKVCEKNPDLQECAGTNHASQVCQPDCKGDDGKPVNITMEQCTSLPDAPNSGSFWNWLWILILIAVIVILLICVTICCVYWKKFGGKGDSKADRRKGKLSMGPMNVSSKVHWKGKHKGSHHKGGHHHKGGSSHQKGGESMRRGTSGKGGKHGGSSMKKSTSANTRKSRKNSGASSGSRR